MISSLHFPLRQRGAALVLVLAFLVIILGLAVAFLTRTRVERSAAAGYAAAASTRQLADIAVNLVQGMIRDATTQGSTVTWASQPGMIRVFDDTGALQQAYKLYSADNLISSSVNLTTDLPPNDWAGAPAVWTDLNAPIAVNGTDNFPILDPTALGLPPDQRAQGFRIDSSDKKYEKVFSGTANPAPMPVKWLYVLKDGTLDIPTGSGRSAGVPKATAANPIVGRIAFWTDDETCKVNLNTAGEGAYWDTPRADTKQERAFADRQPVNHEFQRYPGHPATTSLSAVFPWLTREQILAILPRIQEGGSQGGQTSTTANTANITVDTDRLFASVDELAFGPDNRQSNAADLTKNQLEQAKFFLTTSSRSPETNLFDLPRIACWPLREGLMNYYVTPYDRLLAFCSTINGQPYYFQRKDYSSATHDIGIARNEALYAYLQDLTSRAIPGFGNATFSGKYPDDRDQILTEIFDYIRCANLGDSMLGYNNMFANEGRVVPATRVDPVTKKVTSMGFGRTLTLSGLSIAFICNASGNYSDSNDPATNAVLGGTKLDDDEIYIQSIMIPEFFSVMQGWYRLFSPRLRLEMSGLDSLTITANGTTQRLFPEANGSVDYEAFLEYYWGIYAWGGSIGWRYFGISQGSPPRGNLPGDLVDINKPEIEKVRSLYPFIGTPLRIEDTGTMLFSGGDITVKILDNSQAQPVLVQTFTLHLPSGEFPTPKIVTTGTAGNSPPTVKQNWWAFSRAGISSGTYGRLYYLNNSPANCGRLLRNGFDVVRSILPRHGDFRLIAATPNIEDTDNKLFVPHPLYGDKTELAANSFGGMDAAAPDVGDFSGKYISSLNYPKEYAALIPSNATAKDRPEDTGDYDTGIARAPDGAYINKPDEGNIYGANAGLVPYFDAPNAHQQNKTFFTPNRIMPSAGMFGSLPTGVKSDIPWRTLLFRPQPGHYGATSPKDHLLLDLFWMPVVEPYAISTPFATDGKVNMNFQILPFTYIERPTGLHAILKDEKVAAIPNDSVTTYKIKDAAPNSVFRLDVDIPETLSQFSEIFASGEIFRSASEICDIPIVPSGATAADMATYWDSHQLTGDNLRERIYTTIYPRLTTKSNTYTVHYKVQALQKAPGDPKQWNDDKDRVTGELRGSTTIERYINPNESSIPDYATGPSQTPTLGAFHKWRVLNTRAFAP